MRNRIKLLISVSTIFLLALIVNFTAQSQNAITLKFNEILVINDSSAVDDFGMHSSWIEIFNSSYNTVNIGGCFLTDDLNNPTKYWIPTGDPATKIAARCYTVFWADNHPTRGIFHLNFDLKEAKTIALFDANGKTLIDKVEITAEQKPDITYGRPTNDSNEWVYLEKSTPGANNDYTKKKSAGESFVEIDPYGIGMTVIAMSVVFLALAILYIIYKNMGRFFIRKSNKSIKLATDEVQTSGSSTGEEMSGEVNAAIAMALHLYQSEMHDYENTVLTIQKVSRNYSPWSSKIYTLRKTPNKI
jgi:Na+-transporting methylmalonyl-CoA/oxaloacetate decarboxylase gamma subunit